MKIYHSFSSEDTKVLGGALARALLREKRRRAHATVLALAGELGSGKTTFVQGFFRALGVRARAASPTFILMRRTPLRGKKFRKVFHIDAYRTKRPEDFVALGIREVFADPGNLVLIEWADKIKNILPPRAIRLSFAHKKDPDERKIVIRDHA
ncbi:MAG: tRNA (adenosine(37)-N6)-threonylcarbamoyltransferase complex ATPase subunit type 1 TsaE [Candidatus Liptonbacteria bacterium RIFCSPLOWO2_01_FULL_56_20]|uniref:tRNA threonylcarbamoyladenosine biosynthesis protein TsaE n=1 Tax=Candidatus Liptonbacteria bacterium RIFCSPLOWO2_01_FULL_56_20 TaxID=1798652 RepID=A0A1G2CJ16_9BACT|nr:MAG: hypothetical protein UY96_C0007G0024 [Parcubacteria group bacterium GW2011_GWB1_56_8]OGZ01394.1 MAG: tRNA (adenosine(37)-N6)-threonylcarbamoyltransferase complex ATPase subunit type 1 TsaE [Candidatus Liptonbacteria bacterium RIFCSPLOWO2_01_FULL_56_20]